LENNLDALAKKQNRWIVRAWAAHGQWCGIFGIAVGFMSPELRMRKSFQGYVMQRYMTPRPRAVNSR